MTHDFCRNPRCLKPLALDVGFWAPIGFCWSCRLAIRHGFWLGFGVCTVFAVVFGLLDWLVRF